MIDNDNVAPAAPAESAPAQTISTTPETSPSVAQDTAPPAPKGPSRLQARIDEITRQRYDEQRAREAAEAKLAAYERERTQTQAMRSLESEEPRIDQFDNLPAYQRAYADWTIKRATAQATSQWEQRMQEQAAQQAQMNQRAFAQQQRFYAEEQALSEGMAEGVKKYPDFQAVLTNPELPSVRGTPLFDTIMAAENRVDIAYSLAKKPGELERLLSLHPLQQAREIFRLDAQFSGNAATSAPPAPPPSRNGSPAAQTKDWGEMSTAEHAKAYWGRNRKR